MKIDTKDLDGHMAKFGNLAIGETFLSRQEAYMKVAQSAIDLERGVIVPFEGWMMVNKVDLVVNGIYDR